MVRALGINLSRLRLFVFALGVALAAIAGVVMAPMWGIRPHVGVDAVVPAFLIIVLGGVGSLWGCGLGRIDGRHGGGTDRAPTRRSGRCCRWYLLFIAVVTFPAPRAVRQKSVLDA